MITVYKFGVHYKWTLPDELREQLRTAHDLREDLVTLELAHEHAVKDVWSSYPAVAAAEDALNAAEAASEVAAAEVSRQRVAQRTKRVTGPAADDLTKARRDAKAARVARREAIGEVHQEAAERLSGLAGELRAAQKAMYATYCQDGALYWATFNDVLDHHKTAVKRVKAARASGHPAQMRHHRFDGTGSVAVQLQRQAGQPQRTPATIADLDVGKWRNVLAMPWVDPDRWNTLTRAEQRRQGRVTVRMRCGVGHVEVPIQMHRMLPADADITGARLTVTREGSDYRAHLTVTAKIGEPDPVSTGPTVAVHLGWRNTPTGVVVAHWRSDTPLAIPDDCAAFMMADGTTGKIIMPATIFARLEAADLVQGGRDSALNVAKADLVQWLDAHGPVQHPTREGEEITAAAVACWRNPERFASLAHSWRAAPPENGEEIAEVLEAWRAADKRLWDTATHTTGKALRHRDDLYRQVAAIIADQAGQIVVDDTNLADVARTTSNAPSTVTDPAAKRRTYTAPGSLRAAIIAAATREGVTVTEVPHIGMTVKHAACGHQNPADARYLSPYVTCDGCGSTYDQDDNALAWLMRAAPRYSPAA
jgi:hypothetical protein